MTLNSWISNQKLSFCNYNESESKENEEKIKQLNKEFMRHLLPSEGHRVLILQPAREGKRFRIHGGTEEQSLFEARALIRTLKVWSIESEIRIKIHKTLADRFFTTGKFEELTDLIKNYSKVSAVFVNWPNLTSLQMNTMEKHWGKVIYDRYMMVLQIFKLHSESAESKMQVELAEIPYFQSRLLSLHRHLLSKHVENEMNESLDGLGMGDSSLDQKYVMLKFREHELRARIAELEKRRRLLNETRSRTGIPRISVVGYTNSGKTSLIRCLSRDDKVKPEDNYFATLDVTYHHFYLKLNENDDKFITKVILVDTIGFLSEIPTNLIGAFRCSLRDTIDTDLLIHVVDITNPHWKYQVDFTLSTLDSFKLPHNLLSNILTIGTKADLLSESEVNEIQEENPGMVLMSNITGQNEDLVHKKVKQKLEEQLKLVSKKIKVPIRSEIYNWIRQNAFIENEGASEVDCQFVLLDVLFREDMLRQFHHHFHNKSQS